jgi:hypothetical protein
MFPEAAKLVDDFNRADGNVYAGAGGALWSSTGLNGGANGLNISANQLFATGANGYTLGSFGPDVEVVIDLPTLMAQNEGYVFIAARVQEPGSGTWDGYGAIFIRVGAGEYLHQIRRYDNASSTVLGGTASTAALAAGDQLGFSAIGSVLTLWRRPSEGAWEKLASREDATYSAAGPVGIEVTSSTRLDNLFIGTIGGGGVLHTLELTDSLSLSDSLSKGTGKRLEDAVVLSEAIVKRPGHAEADSLALSDALAKAPTKGLADALPLAEAIGKSAGHVETDALSLSDQIAKGVGHTESDSLPLSDSMGKRVTKGLADALSLADSLVKRAGKALADLLGLSDILATGDKGGPDQAARLTLTDAASTALALADSATTALLLQDRPTTILTLEDQPA